MHETFNWTSRPKVSTAAAAATMDLSNVDVTPTPASKPDPEHLRAEFAADVIAGLASTPKTLPCKYFYDERGSELFNRICDTPEYYPTRAELEILRTYADEISFLAGEGIDVVELGSCNSRKVRVLLDALRAPRAYVPIDVDGCTLDDCARVLRRDYPRLQVLPLAADFTRLTSLPRELQTARRTMFFFAGSTIGNFDPEHAVLLMQQLASLTPRSFFLIGADVKKAPAVLDAAYNDAEGYTAAFNLNLLTRINGELGADFDVEQFRHVAYYDASMHRVEMHVESATEQDVHVGGHTFHLAPGERIQTENSYKYSIQHFQALARAAGLLPVRWWQDSQRQFSLHLLVKASGNGSSYSHWSSLHN